MSPLPEPPHRFSGREREHLDAALARKSLFYWQQDSATARMLERAKQAIGGRYAVATSSGTAALHVAVGAAELQAGSEIIIPCITDMGSLIGPLYQNLVPVFADVDPYTYNITADTIEAVRTARTRAVMVVHSLGTPADMTPIIELCRKHNLVLIEDCAQSYGCYYDGRHVGTFGDFGCFSLNDFKHLSTGEGGFVLMNDEKHYDEARPFADKYYDRLHRERRLLRLGLNYRITELQSAVGLAQFDRFDQATQGRRAFGEALTARLQGLPGIHPPRVPDAGRSSYWFYMLRVNERVLGMSRDTLVAQLTGRGITCSTGYIPRPLYREPVFQHKRFFPGGVWPAELVAGRTYDYQQVTCPAAEEVLATAVKLHVTDAWGEPEADACAKAIAGAISETAHR